MGRPVVLSNGGMFVGLDENGLVHDFYFPYVGQENLTNSRSLQHLIGVWVEGQFSWMNDSDWNISTDFESEALISRISATNSKLAVKLDFADFVDHEYSVFARRITVSNLNEKEREIRLFMHQIFQISRRGRTDTALFVPEGNYLYDYKGRCALLISAIDSQGEAFDQFSIGNYGIEGKEGTFRDAEDGELGGNLVEHGSVDSVVRQKLIIAGNSSDYVDYWVVASFSQLDSEAIHQVFLAQGLHARLDATRNNWRGWLEPANHKISLIDPRYAEIFKKSLLVIKAHVDRRGGTLASGDSSIYNYGRDYYSYVWPRDGALTMLTMMRLGFQDEPKRFFEFCIDTINPDGYMMHKYQPDRSIGSTWHPLVHKHHPELAIQEDETAVVVYALGKYFRLFDDSKFLEHAYHNFVKPAANFMSRFIDGETNLPHASYDLWEEKFGTHTYTVVLTKAALVSAAEIGEKLGQHDSPKIWRAASERINSGLEQLFDSELGCYLKGQLLNNDGSVEKLRTIDVSSTYSFMEFLPTAMGSEEYKKSIKTTIEKLLDTTPSGGAVRYEGDNYFRTNPAYLGNPWILCSLWIAQYYARTGQTDQAQRIVDWAVARATPSGILSEQINPDSGDQVGVSPLVWSHAELVNTMLDLAEK